MRKRSLYFPEELWLLDVEPWGRIHLQNRKETADAVMQFCGPYCRLVSLWPDGSIRRIMAKGLFDK